MDNAMLVSLSYCKEILSLDERDTLLLDHQITVASRIAMKYLGRNILLHSCRQYEDSRGQTEILLASYPVRSLESVACDPERIFSEETRLPPEAYSLSTPLEGVTEDLPSSILLDPFLALPRGRRTIEITYSAGYALDEIPEDIRAAVVEIVSWNRRRYTAGQIGTAGPFSPTGKISHHTLERSLPENVKALLSPYARRSW